MSREPRSTQSQERSIAIVGGGIAGMYCARHLAAHADTFVTLFEATDRYGGRIETSRKLKPFIAEFGPMRFEPELQPRFQRLCSSLKGVETRRFPGPKSPTLSYPVKSSLPPDEREAVSVKGARLTALDLLTLGVYRLTAEDADDDSRPYQDKLEAWRSEIRGAGPHDLKKREAEIRERPVPSVHDQHDTNTPLYRLGFWNALSEVLSHRALKAIRDEGTFYHLIPDNPNAAEWTIWWLRLLVDPSNELATIPEGVDSITRALKRKLTAAARSGRLLLQPQREVVSVEASSDPSMIRLRIRDWTSERGNDHYEQEFDHVILALPKAPLMKLSQGFCEEAKTALDGAFGFPMLKAFLVKEDPWWKRKTLWNNQYPSDIVDLRRSGRLPVASQRRASEVPTRELHYFYSEKEDLGMVMLYTDRPATEYWRHFVDPDRPHNAAEVYKRSSRLPENAQLLQWALAHYLAYEHGEARREEAARKAVGRDPKIRQSREALRRWQAATSTISEFLTGVAELGDLAGGGEQRDALKGLVARVQDVESPAPVDELRKIRSFGIRDWAAEPYGAGNHAWRPGVEWWRLLDTLAAFGLQGREQIRNLHVCGEAYSDWHGFIEGALDSAAGAMKPICDAEGCDQSDL
jgi:Flavin containing amine oxidoreductase